MPVLDIFKCSDLEDVRGKVLMNFNWCCHRRESYFNSISSHCHDCDRYKSMYEQLVALLEGDSVG